MKTVVKIGLAALAISVMAFEASLQPDPGVGFAVALGLLLTAALI